MPLFYLPNIQEEAIVFDAFLTKYLVAVLRKKSGDLVHLTDGCGGCFEVVLTKVTKKHCEARLLKKTFKKRKHQHRLHLAMAPTKSNDRMTWMVEKLTEIGIDEITFLKCERSERKNINAERMQKTAIAAMQQSLRYYLPKVNPMVALKDFLSESANTDAQKFIAHCEALPNQLFKKKVIPQKPSLALIGPEGDFSKREVQLANQQGFKDVSLGTVRYRTETAALVLASILAVLHD